MTKKISKAVLFKILFFCLLNISILLFLTSCNSSSNSVFSRSVPDEFYVTTLPPLSFPEIVTLQPPTKEQSEEVNSWSRKEIRASNYLIENDYADYGDDFAYLKWLQIENINPNIKNIIKAETTGLTLVPKREMDHYLSSVPISNSVRIDKYLQ